MKVKRTHTESRKMWEQFVEDIRNGVERSYTEWAARLFPEKNKWEGRAMMTHMVSKMRKRGIMIFPVDLGRDQLVLKIVDRKKKEEAQRNRALDSSF